MSEPQSELVWQSHAHHRKSDPETSRQSAASAKSFAVRHASQCLDVLREMGAATQSEIAAKCGLLPHQVNKRLADLRNRGLILTTGITRPGHANRQEREWRAQ